MPRKQRQSYGHHVPHAKDSFGEGGHVTQGKVFRTREEVILEYQRRFAAGCSPICRNDVFLFEKPSPYHGEQPLPPDEQEKRLLAVLGPMNAKQARDAHKLLQRSLVELLGLLQEFDGRQGHRRFNHPRMADYAARELGLPPKLLTGLLSLAAERITGDVPATINRELEGLEDEAKGPILSAALAMHGDETRSHHVADARVADQDPERADVWIRSLQQRQNQAGSIPM